MGNGTDHMARVECAERLAAIETHMGILDEVREEVRTMDARLVKVESWVQAQNGTLGEVRQQVVAILRALDVFQQHSKEFEEGMKEYRQKREELEQKGRAATEERPEETKLGLIRRMIEERATWVIVGIIVAVALMLGIEFWRETAKHYVDSKLPAAVATPTPTR